MRLEIIHKQPLSSANHNAILCLRPLIILDKVMSEGVHTSLVFILLPLVDILKKNVKVAAFVGGQTFSLEIWPTGGRQHLTGTAWCYS